MKYKIGVFGSSIDESEQLILKAQQLGKSIAVHHCDVITGACSGLPYQAAKSAHKNGAEVYGFSPVTNQQEQIKFTPNDDISIYKEIFFVPGNFEFKNNILISKKYRNVISTAHCDAGIIISGRWGTLNEFTNLFEMGKIIGVLTETAGIANELPGLSTKISKETDAQLIFNHDPGNLVKQVVAAIQHTKL